MEGMCAKGYLVVDERKEEGKRICSKRERESE
jgi:hypothetical protein